MLACQRKFFVFARISLSVKFEATTLPIGGGSPGHRGERSRIGNESRYLLSPASPGGRRKLV